MLSAKLDPKIYSVDLHFVLYFIEFWKNMLYFLTYFNKNDCKPLKMININDRLVVYLDKKSHVWDFIAFGTLWYGYTYMYKIMFWSCYCLYILGLLIKHHASHIPLRDISLLKTLQAWNYPLPRRESTLVKNADKPRLEPDCRYFWHLLEQIDSVEP